MMERLIAQAYKYAVGFLAVAIALGITAHFVSSAKLQFFLYGASMAFIVAGFAYCKTYLGLGQVTVLKINKPAQTPATNPRVRLEGHSLD